MNAIYRHNRGHHDDVGENVAPHATPCDGDDDYDDDVVMKLGNSRWPPSST